MRTSHLIVVPCILIVGLLFGAYGLKGFIRGDAPCVVGTCPSTLYEGDAGKTFVYNVATRFSLILDGRKNPQRYLECNPAGVIESVQNTPSVNLPLYAVTFAGSSPGTCTLASNSFVATIIIQ